MARGAQFYPIGSLWRSRQRTVSDSLQGLCVFYRNAQTSPILMESKKKFWKSNSVNLIRSLWHKTVVFKLACTSAWSGGVPEIQIDEPHPQSYRFCRSAGAWVSASQTSSQVMLMSGLRTPLWETWTSRYPVLLKQRRISSYFYFSSPDYYFQTGNLCVWG